MTHNINDENIPPSTIAANTSASCLLTTSSRQSSADSNYNWSSSASTEDADGIDGMDRELSLTTDSTNSKNDFLLKYLNAQNNYLQSIWHDGIALLEYSLHLLQQQEFRLSCRVAHRCLELFQKQQLEQQRLRHQRRQNENWNNLNTDLYGANNNGTPNVTGTPNAAAGAFGNGLFMVDPITNQPAQIPGLWYIEMHLANCYHTWGQSNMALYHINRTLDQLGNYQINPDSLTVRLNTRRKFKLLSSYLVQNTEKALKRQTKSIVMSGSGSIRSSPRKTRRNSNPLNDETNVNMLGRVGNNEEKQQMIETEMKLDHLNDNNTESAQSSPSKKTHSRRRSFMRKIKINNRRRRKSNVFSKLFDRFSGNKKKNKNKKTKRGKQSQQEKDRESYNMDDSKSSTNGDNEIDSPLSEFNENALFSGSRSPSNRSRSGSHNSVQSSPSSRTRSSRLSLVDYNEDPEEEEEDEQKEIQLDPDTLNLQLCLEDDLNVGTNDTDNEMDEEDEELEVEFFNNDDDDETDNEDDGLDQALDGNGTQMITLEALLSMHMTKGRILIEMKLLREALDLYTYIIDECEALIKYHSMVNPHHIQLEHEFDLYEEEKLNAMDTASSSASSSINSRDRHRRHHRRNRRRSRDNLNDDGHGIGLHGHRHHHHHHHAHPPPNTPFRRLTKNIGLENYYAARGDIYFKFKDLKNALADFSNAIKYGKCKKEMGIYYNLRGVCFHEMKQYDRALRDYDNAVKSMYGNHVAWNNRAALLVDMRQYDDAIENANNAIKLDPSYGNAINIVVLLII
eukprot:CAMPEP_0201573058 /NCGR_PEP_ID=MMETSP0190_2-20130828/16695_1 /ASSEMBLY_ACC=CAM_ASM_000263 /TAXON_ID=37353 /ORGANISM="Rosalina sp." /LENGTH=791 /DNA_ID=CAMNT_0047999559 /DNA_START=1528 /DNA_END=3904 /DNA_ORIENTATION=-